MYGKLQVALQEQLENIKEQGLYKTERIIASPQAPHLKLVDGQELLNFCANNYLGLSNHPEIIKAAREALVQWGFGLSSVRFICGTQQIHKELEKQLADFLGTEDTILFSSCFDANGGVFEPLFDEQCAIISDELNHASIIDGVRLCKAQRFRYKHMDMTELEKCLIDSSAAKYRIIVTDGVFSMDGHIAPLPQICELAEKYESLVMIDDSHATGYLGDTGRGTAEYYGLLGKIDLITTTFGKALGGASGGCISGRREIIEFMRQRSRPYLFSNSVSPSIVGATLKALEIVRNHPELPHQTIENARRFRQGIESVGFDVIPGNSAIVPIMIYEEPLAIKIADLLLKEGIYVVGFTYPVVPRGTARIRVQLSAAHTPEQINRAISAFKKIKTHLKDIKNSI
ncbi:MAG: glycine C-acetyltransferase [Candidatus Marinimicrobia bacterium]|nr:glycine C-acetyltransferase [Candidatus Neomarinimicrobiota bacterium]MDD5540822.1 glycine C-acetyltransferase [Candidatus Neomarinimicrobiota bacterium]